MTPDEFQDLCDDAFAALAGGDYVRALAVADQLAAEKPEDAVIRTVRAQALLGADAGEDAVEEARKAVRIDPSSDYAHRLLGMSAWRAGRLTLAQESFERAVELSGRRPVLLAEYAWFMANQRGPRLAERAAKEAVDADPESSTAWAALGLAQHKLHQRHEAEASLSRALQLNPNDLYAQGAMATLLQDMRRDPQAEALAELVKETPGTEDLVEEIHREAKRRQVARMLVERQAMPETPDRTYNRRLGLWLLTAATMIGGLLVLMQPKTPLEWTGCIVFPLVFLFLLRKLLD
jgi:Tfp pilus assembly protein PilF